MDKIGKLKKRVEECLNSSPVSDKEFISWYAGISQKLLGENIKILALQLIEKELMDKDQSQKQQEVEKWMKDNKIEKFIKEGDVIERGKKYGIWVEPEKQPEGEKIVWKDYSKGDLKHVAEAIGEVFVPQSEPEKQEEWREEIEKRLVKVMEENLATYPMAIENDVFEVADVIIPFISQLLSERTFNKEEWREIGICKNCFGNNIGRKYHDADYKKGVKAIGIKVCLDCGCEDICNLGDLSQLLSEEYQRGVKEATEGKFYKKVEFVSEIPKEIVDQLLSERTFTKEELKRISKRVNEYDKDSYEDELDCEIVEKIDNLLKEEE